MSPTVLIALCMSVVVIALIVPAQSIAQVPEDGLVAYYPMDGSAEDATLNANHGAVNGAQPTKDRFGNEKGAYEFDGDDYIVFASSAQNTFTGPFSVSAWVSVASFETGQAIEQHPIVSKISQDGWTGGYEVIANAGQANNYFSAASTIGGQNTWTSSSATAELDRWHHVVAVYDGAGLNIYQDGTLTSITPEARSGATSSSSLELVVGRRSGGGDYWFRGKVDDVRLYSRSLTMQEVEKLHGAESVSFAGANLRGRDFRNTSLVGVSFENANLTGVDFRSANLSGAILDGANLMVADLRGADLTGASLVGASFNGTEFDESTIWPDGFDEAAENVTRVELWGANLQDLHLEERDWTGKDLQQTLLQNTKLTSGAFDNASFFRADLRNVDLTGSTAAGLVLDEANLTGADLAGVALDGARFDSQTKWPVGFDIDAHNLWGPGVDKSNSDLSLSWPTQRFGLYWLDLSNANLSGSTLSSDDSPVSMVEWRFDGADLAGASLRSANIRGTSFRDADLSGADFAGVGFNELTNLYQATWDGTTKWPSTLTPQILQSPVALMAASGEDATFSVFSFSLLPQSYQWFRDGEEIPGAVGPTLTIRIVQDENAGSYHVKITSATGEVVATEPVSLAVVPPTVSYGVDFTSDDYSRTFQDVYLEAGKTYEFRAKVANAGNLSPESGFWYGNHIPEFLGWSGGYPRFVMTRDIVYSANTKSETLDGITYAYSRFSTSISAPFRLQLALWQTQGLILTDMKLIESGKNVNKLNNGSFRRSGDGWTLNNAQVTELWNGVHFLLSIADGVESLDLTFGSESGATDGMDEGYDVLAPPPPPAGVFDARLRSNSDDYYTDIRGPVAESASWSILTQSGNGDIVISWDPSALPEGGSFTLKDQVTGGIVNVNMREVSQVTMGTPFPLLLTYSVDVTASTEIASGWNMVGIPVSMASAMVSDVFPSALNNTLYEFSGTYQAPQNGAMQTGKGYWLRFPSADTKVLTGRRIPEMTLSLASGWNMISGPTCSVPQSEVVDGDLTLNGTLFEFDGTYQLATSMLPGKGYWIRASREGSLIISCSPVSSGKSDGLIAAGTDTWPRLTFRDDVGREQHLYVSSERSAEGSYTLPPSGPSEYWRVAFDGDSYVGSESNGLIRLTGTQQDLMLTSDGHYNVELLAADGSILSTGAVGESPLRISSQVRSVRLMVSELPTEFVLHAAYPNPFNPVTNLSFDLPEDATIHVAVYDLVGRRVMSLVREHMTAGTARTIQLDASRLASGQYFYRLTARMESRAETATGRIILLK